jgi:hypothetical protein
MKTRFIGGVPAIRLPPRLFSPQAWTQRRPASPFRPRNRRFFDIKKSPDRPEPSPVTPRIVWRCGREPRPPPPIAAGRIRYPYPPGASPFRLLCLRFSRGTSADLRAHGRPPFRDLPQRSARTVGRLCQTLSFSAREAPNPILGAAREMGMASDTDALQFVHRFDRSPLGMAADR